MAGPGVDQDKQYCYPDHHHHVSSSSGLVDQNMLAATGHLQSFEPSSDIYNLTSGMDMMIGFQQKNYLSQESHQATSGLWKPFLNRPHGGGQSSEFYQSDALAVLPEWNNHQNPSLMASHVFACGGNERQRSQGLSLSLTSSSSSSIQLQSFELKRQSDDLSFGPSSFQIIRTSKYLGPARELLIELCNLGTKQTDKVMKIQKNSEGMDEINGVKNQSLYSLDLPELQKRKTKLLLMLEQVDRRYKHYCDQMKAVVQSFEAVAGDGAATVYSFMASKAMSRHFRCLRDGVMTQIKATKKAIGDKDTAAPNATKGETPRLRVLDQTLRQQKAFHQTGFMETHPWRPQRGLPERSVSVLRAWLFEHFLHPYPSDVDKHILARQTGLSRSQVSNWFINARVRLWKPMVEEMYLEDVKEHDGCTANLEGKLDDQENQNHSRNDEDDQKPTHDQLFRIDSECLSSIISNINPDKDNGKRNKALANEYSATEFNFSSYNDHHRAPGSTVGGSGVSLTLGLHQHGGSSGGVSLAFSHQGTQSSLFYPRDQMEDCQTVPYSLLESDHQSQGLQYRNLMSAQLFHDFAG